MVQCTVLVAILIMLLQFFCRDRLLSVFVIHNNSVIAVLLRSKQYVDHFFSVCTSTVLTTVSERYENPHHLQSPQNTKTKKTYSIRTTS